MRAGANDPAGIAPFYDLVSPDLRGISQRILASPDEAEQALEIVLLRVWNQAGLTEGTNVSAEAWTFLAVRAEAVRRQRAGKGLPALNAPDLQHSAPAWLARTEEMNLLQSRRELLRRSLAQLPQAQRRVLDLMLYEGLTEEETAAALNEPLGKVRDQVRAALAFARHRVHTLMGTWTAGI